MREPNLVAESVAAMTGAVRIPVTVKCRIGVDDQEPREALFAFAEKVKAAGAAGLIVHARKAWLDGLNPKDNRTIPPLDYPLVYELKRAHPRWPIVINGGIANIAEARAHLHHVDGVMLGRAAYQNPELLLDVDTELFGDAPPFPELLRGPRRLPANDRAGLGARRTAPRIHSPSDRSLPRPPGCAALSSDARIRGRETRRRA